MSTSTLQNAPDLAKSFPRSPNSSLGNYVLLPRIIDKCRATVAGTQGEYKYNCPLDRQFFDFFKLDAEQFQAQVAAGKTDAEILAWVQQTTKSQSETTIKAWSYCMRWRRPEGEETVAYFETLREQIAPDNYRIETWFQLLDADEGRF